MNWQKYRLPIGGALLAALTLVLALGLRARHSDSVVSKTETPTIPSPERDKITAFAVMTPGKETIRIEQVDREWRVVEPLSADTDEGAVRAALEKLASMRVVTVAATKEANHDRLEVSAAKGTRVQAFQGAKVALDFRIGAYRSGNTMVRLEGAKEVLAVQGALTGLFKRELRDWRNRKMVNIQPDRVLTASFAVGDTTYRFVRGDATTWKQADGEDKIEGFEGAKAQAIIAALSQLSATDFGKPGLDAAAAGMNTPAATVTLTLGEAPKPPAPKAPEGADKKPEGTEAKKPAGEASSEPGKDGAAKPEAAPKPPTTLVLRLGAATGEPDQHYVQVDGKPVIYIVPTALADKLRVTKESFTASAKDAPPPPPEGGFPGGIPGLPPGMMPPTGAMPHGHPH